MSAARLRDWPGRAVHAAPRLPLTVALVGIGAVVAPSPAQAMTVGLDGGGAQGPGVEGVALSLLHRAAAAQRTRSYSGEQYVGLGTGVHQRSMLLQVRHSPSGSSVGTGRPTAGARVVALPTGTAALLDAPMVDLLAARYDLVVRGRTTVAGRAAAVVEARRAGESGPGAVAGRFWLDAETGLVLRRDVLDERGRAVRTSAFRSLSVLPATGGTDDADAAADPAPVGGTAGGAAYAPRPGAVAAPMRVGAAAVPDELAAAAAPLEPVAQSGLARLQAAGWPVPEQLGDALHLFDAALLEQDGAPVLQLSYSDGLSTLSLFVQRGRPGSRPPAGFVRTRRGGATVWVREAVPERIVWSGGGSTFTLLSDAPPGTVDGVVAALPHGEPPRGGGLLHRLGRGLHRVGSWLNPFH